MSGRTHVRWARVYGNGYDLSGFSRTAGPFVEEFEEGDLTVWSDAVKGYLPAHASLTPTELIGNFDNTATSGLHVLANGANSVWDIMFAIGDRAAPAQGDPVFMGKFLQTGYAPVEDGSVVTARVTFGMYDVNDLIAYQQAWGWLLHPNEAETAVNTATGIDDNGASSALGGFMMYQVLSGNGTATIKVQHASTNLDGSFSDLGGCTTGVIDCSSPSAGILQATSKSTTVNRYLRWQIVLGTATTVTFALAFVRGR